MMDESITGLLDHMSNALDEAEEYCYEGMPLKASHPQIYQTYMSLANQHLRHFDDLSNALSQTGMDDSEKMACGHIKRHLMRKYQRIKGMM